MDLIISSAGASLSKRKGMFYVETDQLNKHFSPHKIQSIMVHKACRISSDAILLAMQHEIPLVFLGYNGKAWGRIWSPCSPGLTSLRHQQLLFARHDLAATWVIRHICDKILRQICLLQAQPTPSPFLLQSIESLQSGMQDLLQLKSSNEEGFWATLRGKEGHLSKICFATLPQILPQQWRFQGRSRRPAADPFNAMLNYLYGLLYAHCENALLLCGLDPYIPVMHREGHRLPAFVFDFIKAFRPWADQTTLEMFRSSILQKGDFENLSNGIQLNRSGRGKAIAAFTPFLEQKEGPRSRKQQVLESARSLVRLIRSTDENQDWSQAG